MKSIFYKWGDKGGNFFCCNMNDYYNNNGVLGLVCFF